MKITKLEHSCLVLEQDNRILVIDPGSISDSFKPTPNIDAVIITHEHSDHFDPTKIAAIHESNPDAKILTTAKVATQLTNATEIHAGDQVTIGSFSLEFFGQNHAPIVDDVVPCDNFGVTVNGVFSYPGDSFIIPPMKPAVLALPVSAPWLKVDEIIKYLAAVQPARAFPTHNALLSKVGQDVTYNWVRPAAIEMNIEFIDLQPGQSIEI